MAKKAKINDKSINWIDLPKNCKQNIIGNLDYVDRTLLSHCSKSDYELVCNTPFFIKELRFEQITELKYRILVPGCIEMTVEDPHRHRNLRNKRVFHDYVLFNRQTMVRKSDRDGFSRILNNILNRFLDKENFTIGTLRLDDTFFLNYNTRYPSSVRAKIENLKIEKAQTSPKNWISTRGDGFGWFGVDELEGVKSFMEIVDPHHLKSLTLGHEIGTLTNMQYEYEYDDDGDSENDEYGRPRVREPVFFDKFIIQNLSVLILPARQTIRPRHLALLKARKLVIWSPCLEMRDFCDLLKRWDSEDAAVGSSVRIGLAEPDLKMIEGFKGLEILEAWENQMMIKMSSGAKKFRVFTEKPKEICCEVIDF